MASLDEILASLDKRVAAAVKDYWTTRSGQEKKQKKSGRKDQGARAAVTGGAQMDGLVRIAADIVIAGGIKPEHVFFKRAIELPGFFRPTKKWDLLVVQNGQLLVVLEAKSQVGPSFGNNVNNRFEEAVGNAVDLWTAYREGAFNSTIKPWLGYLALLEDCPESRAPLTVREPHFKIFPEFRDASYAKRYDMFCRKIVRERHYNSACFLFPTREKGAKGIYEEPGKDLTFNLFARSLYAHVSAFKGIA